MEYFYRIGFVTLAIFFFVNSYGSENNMAARMADEQKSSLVVWIFFTDKGPSLENHFYKAEAKLLPHARQRRLRNRGAGNLVDFHDLPVFGDYIRELRRLGIQIRHKSRWLNAVSAEIPGEMQETIRSLDFVKKLQPVAIYKSPSVEIEKEKPNASFSKGLNTYLLNYGPSLTQNAQIKVPELHDLGFDGSGVIVAMLDAGFNNLQHEALQHLDIIKTWDFVNGDSIVEDESGQMGSGNHGTYTLNTLAGFAPGWLIGPAYNASFLLAKTENTDYERNIEEDHWVAGAEWADSLGADIISSSLGYLDFDAGQKSYSPEDMDGNTAVTTIGADIAASRGILVVNSAGNQGPTSKSLPNTLVAPSDGDSVLAVGAVDSNGNRVNFSSMGPTSDGRIKPDVMAMGSSVLSASPFSSNGYVRVSGTSLSCPLAAGTAALLMQIHPEWSNMDVLNALRNHASNAENPDNSMGWGIINAEASASGITNIRTDDAVISDFRLLPTFPNPFNSTVQIRFQAPDQKPVVLSVFNVSGQKIATLFEGIAPAGEQQLSWNAARYPSGIYYLILEAGQQQQLQKMVLVR